MGRNIERKEDNGELERGRKELLDILSSIPDREGLVSFLDDILTEKEKDEIAERYLLMDDLYRGKSQRDIAKDRSMSLCKITRGSKMLKKKDGFMRRYFSDKYDDFTHI